jgi:hypothetical protein
MYRLAYLAISAIICDRYYKYKKVLDNILRAHKASVVKQRMTGTPNTAAKWRVLNTVLKPGSGCAVTRSGLRCLTPERSKLSTATS